MKEEPQLDEVQEREERICCTTAVSGPWNFPKAQASQSGMHEISHFSSLSLSFPECQITISGKRTEALALVESSPCVRAFQGRCLLASGLHCICIHLCGLDQYM